jgi:hypothetical protein
MRSGRRHGGIVSGGRESKAARGWLRGGQSSIAGAAPGGYGDITSFHMIAAGMVPGATRMPVGRLAAALPQLALADALTLSILIRRVSKHVKTCASALPHFHLTEGLWQQSSIEVIDADRITKSAVRTPEKSSRSALPGGARCSPEEAHRRMA